jgi:hypothetical protein
MEFHRLPVDAQKILRFILDAPDGQVTITDIARCRVVPDLPSYVILCHLNDLAHYGYVTKANGSMLQGVGERSWEADTLQRLASIPDEI